MCHCVQVLYGLVAMLPRRCQCYRAIDLPTPGSKRQGAEEMRPSLGARQVT